MTTHQLLKTMRRLWWLPVAAIIVSSTAAYSVGHMGSPSYTATATLLVSPAKSNNYINNQDLQTMAFTYAELVETLPVLNPVANTLDLGVPGQELLPQVRAEVIRETRLINISVSNIDARRSALIANEIAKQFGRYVRARQLDQASAAVALVTPATVPENPTPALRLSVVLAGAAGLVAAMGIVFLGAYLEASKALITQRS